MGIASEGKAFIQHEIDAAIAVQQEIVDAERALAQRHPLEEAKDAIGRMIDADERSLHRLQDLARKIGSTSGTDEMAAARQTSSVSMAAGDAPSDAYAAHAALVSNLRKQQDSS